MSSGCGMPSTATLNAADGQRLQTVLDAIAEPIPQRWAALDQLRYFCDGADAPLLEAIGGKRFSTLHTLLNLLDMATDLGGPVAVRTAPEHQRVPVGLVVALLECLLWLLAQGCVFPVLSKLSAWLVDADLSLVRHLMQQLLGLIAPPYSPAFGKALLAMMRHPRTLEAHRTAESKQPLLAAAQLAARSPDSNAPSIKPIHSVAVSVPAK